MPLSRMFIDILLIIVSALLLWFGAEWIVESASAIARAFNVSELVIGLTVVAIGTSAPEFLVTATAAFKGMADISLSNVVGSNIFNLGFILGLMAAIRPLPTNRTMLYRDGLLLFSTTALILATAFFFRVLTRPFGIFLLALLAGYVLFLLFRARSGLPEPEPETKDRRKADWKDYPKLAAGFAGIALGGHLMVESASSLALALGVSRWVVGVTVVAAGTSLPELVTCLSAAFKGKSDMLLGNLIGSDLFNFAGVLGLTCLLRPLEVSPEALPSLGVLVAMVAVVLVFMRTGWRVSRVEGLILVSVNLLRWVRDFSG